METVKLGEIYEKNGVKKRKVSELEYISDHQSASPRNDSRDEGEI